MDDNRTPATNAKPTGHFEDLNDRKAFVVDQYERLWSGVLEKVQAAIASGEKDLARLHLSMRRMFGPSFTSQHLAEKYRTHEDKKKQTGIIFDRQIISFHNADTRIGTFMTDALKMRTALDWMAPDTERIIETGAGWGKTLFNLWLYGAPKHAEFWAFELTQAGRQAAELLIQHAQSPLQLKTAPFDHYAPDFACLGHTPKKTAVITHHSIEQIPVLGRNWIDALLALPGFDRCIHLEPVGWQIPTNNWLAEDTPQVCERMQHIDRENSRFSLKKNQNTNLYPLLRESEQCGRIKIYAVRKYLCSHLMANATTLIVWGPPDSTPGDITDRDDLLPEPGALKH